MQSGYRNAAEQRPRAAMVHENANVSACMEAFGVAEEWTAEPTSTPSKAPRFNQQWSSNRAKPVQMNSREVICHNCSGVRHIQRNCPSPPKTQTPCT
ncbi:Protein mushroom body miniature [Dissostichus eleginoides]|uniref:Protein mushroom body miniature n=1 Tax=Dissostichus eleginoides TaxID=100907 RepID=A0AAD9CN28_DISEL|nr:Protein mushroom body miniature [Dissostichus eleginoides]